MARIKRATHARKKKKAYLKAAKGYRGGRSRLLRTVKDAVDRSREYSYRDRRVRKREFRRLWITRINAAIREYGLSYSVFVNGLKKVGLELDRKALAYIAYTDKAAFGSIVQTVKQSIDASPGSS